MLALGRKLVEELRVPDSRDPLALQSTDAGFVLLQSVASVRVLITTTVPNIELCEPPTHRTHRNAALHISYRKTHKTCDTDTYSYIFSVVLCIRRY